MARFHECSPAEGACRDGGTVLDGTRGVGTLAKPPPENSAFRLGGKTWRVRSIDLKRRAIYVDRARGKAETLWTGDGLDMHDRIAQRIRDLLQGDTRPAYLAPPRLPAARGSPRLRETNRHPQRHPRRSPHVLPWRGTKYYRGLKLHFDATFGPHSAIETLPPYALTISQPLETVQAALATSQPRQRLLDLVPDPELESL